MRINIGGKILGVSVLLITLMISLSIYEIAMVDRIEDRLAVTADSLIPLIGHVAAIDSAALEQEIRFNKILRRQSMTAEQRQAARNEWRAYTPNIEQEIATARREISEILANADYRDEAVPLARFDTRFIDLYAEYSDMLMFADRILDLEAEGRHEIAEELLSVLDAEEAQFDKKLKQITQEAVALARDTTRRTAEEERQARISTLVLTGSGALLGLIIATVITRGIVRPVQRLLTGFETLEAGDFAISLDITSRDEVGKLTAGFNHMVGEIQAKEQIKDAFGRYIDPRIVEKIIENSDRAAMDGERREMTVFFSDLADFTTISEMLTASALVRLLNAYFSRMSTDIRAGGGIIDKFIGDAIMAYWGPPFVSQETMAPAACLAALRNIAQLDEFSRDIPEITGLRTDPPSIMCRIGLATGPVVVGNIGSDASKNYTVMGDTVNLGARLEGANKIYGTQILACQNTYAAARNEIHFREIDLLAVKGKSEPTAIYEPLGSVESTAPEKLELANRFNRGIAAYRAQSWDEAVHFFKECQKQVPGDAPSNMFIERISALREQDLPNNWDGVWRVVTK